MKVELLFPRPTSKEKQLSGSLHYYERSISQENAIPCSCKARPAEMNHPKRAKSSLVGRWAT